MIEDAGPPARNGLIRIEPGDRLVVLARTLQAREPGSEAEGAPGPSGLGGACLGRALYRHRSVFRGTSEAPAWSHLDLITFRDVVPAEALRDLVFDARPGWAHLLRAEILLTTPSSFVVPESWRGAAARPGRLVSIEYIDVRPHRLGDYRDVMRRYIGPAAARLVARDEVGSFRAMETAAVLCRDPSFDVDWNQIHLCEVDADTFGGFGQAFDAALRDIAPEGVFAGLDAMRTIPRWTFNDAVVEAHPGLTRLGSGMPPLERWTTEKRRCS